MGRPRPRAGPSGSGCGSQRARPDDDDNDDSRSRGLSGPHVASGRGSVVLQRGRLAWTSSDPRSLAGHDPGPAARDVDISRRARVHVTGSLPLVRLPRLRCNRLGRLWSAGAERSPDRQPSRKASMTPRHQSALLVVAILVSLVILAGAGAAGGGQLPPSNTSLPTISGTAKEGQTLSASPGSWSSTFSVTYAYQWQQCDSTGAGCANVAGATGQSYSLITTDVGHTIRVVVTATNKNGASSASSAPTAVVAADRGGTFQPLAAGDLGLDPAGADALGEHRLLERHPALELQLPVVPLRLGRQQLRSERDRGDRSAWARPTSVTRSGCWSRHRTPPAPRTRPPPRPRP